MRFAGDSFTGLVKKRQRIRSGLAAVSADQSYASPQPISSSPGCNHTPVTPCCGWSLTSSFATALVALTGLRQQFKTTLRLRLQLFAIIRVQALRIEAMPIVQR